MRFDMVDINTRLDVLEEARQQVIPVHRRAPGLFSEAIVVLNGAHELPGNSENADGALARDVQKADSLLLGWIRKPANLTERIRDHQHLGQIVARCWLGRQSMVRIGGESAFIAIQIVRGNPMTVRNSWLGRKAEGHLPPGSEPLGFSACQVSGFDPWPFNP